MPIDPIIIKLRLDRILSMCTDLEDIHEYGRKKYLESGLLQAASQRQLHVAIQAMIDIATHIIAHKHWGAPETYSDSIIILARRNLLGSDLASQLVQLVKLRNVIIHMYLDLDSSLIFDSLAMIIAKLKQFIQVIKKELETLIN